jgi:hypothetical protein
MPYPNDGSLAAYYAAESGSLLVDSSGNGRTLTLTGGVTSVAGKVGNAADFPGGAFGSGNGHLEIPAATVAGVSALSCCGWFKLDTLGTIDLRPIFAFSDAGANNLFYFTPANNSSTNRPLVVGKFGGVQYSAALTTAFVTGTWYFFGVAFSAKGLFLYIGYGQADFQGASASTSGNGTINYTTNNLGKHVTNLGPLLDGQIDEFAVFRRHLYEAEFRAIWNNGAGHTYAEVAAIPEITVAGSDQPKLIQRNTRSLKIAGQTSRIVPASGRMYPRPE